MLLFRFESNRCGSRYITSDGCFIMEKLGELLGGSTIHQLCLAHETHLAVVDIIYQK